MGYAIGAAVVGAFVAGGSAAIVAGSIASMLAYVVGYAVVGAAIGGLTAAITGGDIGKGILYGGIGGAVTGGFAGYFAGAAGAGAGSAVGMTSANLDVAAATGNAYGSTGTATSIGASGAAAGSGSGSLLAGIGDGAGSAIGGIGSSLINLGGKAIEGSAAEDMAKTRLEFENEQREKEMQLMERLQGMKGGSAASQAELNAATQRYGIDAQRDTAKAQLAEQTRQFDVARQLDAESLARKQGAVQQAVAARKGVLRGAPVSIDQQVATQEKDIQQTLAPTLEQQEKQQAVA